MMGKERNKEGGGIGGEGNREEKQAEG